MFIKRNVFGNLILNSLFGSSAKPAMKPHRIEDLRAQAVRYLDNPQTPWVVREMRIDPTRTKDGSFKRGSGKVHMGSIYQGRPDTKFKPYKVSDEVIGAVNHVVVVNKIFK